MTPLKSLGRLCFSISCLSERRMTHCQLFFLRASTIWTFFVSSYRWATLRWFSHCGNIGVNQEIFTLVTFLCRQTCLDWRAAEKELDKQDDFPLPEGSWAEQPGWATRHPALVFAVLTWHMWPGGRHAASQECEEASKSKCQTCGELAVLYEAVTQVRLNKSANSQIRTAKPFQNCTQFCLGKLEKTKTKKTCLILKNCKKDNGWNISLSLSFVSCAKALSFIKSLPSFLHLSISTTWLWLHLMGSIGFEPFQWTTNHVLLKSVSSKSSSVIVA